MNVLELDSVLAGYGRNRVLHSVSLKIVEREIVAVLGRNAAGKSTLLKTVVGLLENASGRVCLNGKDISGIRARARIKQGIGFVMQGGKVFPRLTVEENIRAGCHWFERKEADRRVQEQLDRYPQLRERRNMPAGKLSGGERQRVAIATVLSAAPSLLLLDEPFAALDREGKQSLAHELERLRKEQRISILLVEQDAQTAASVSDRAVIIEQGKAIWEGKSDWKEIGPILRNWTARRNTK